MMSPGSALPANPATESSFTATSVKPLGIGTATGTVDEPCETTAEPPADCELFEDEAFAGDSFERRPRNTRPAPMMKTDAPMTMSCVERRTAIDHLLHDRGRCRELLRSCGPIYLVVASDCSAC